LELTPPRFTAYRTWKDCIGCLKPKPPLNVKLTLHYLELPVNVSLNLTRRPESRLENLLYCWWNVSVLLGWTEKDIRPTKIKVLIIITAGGSLFGNLGVEVSHEFSEKYNVGSKPGLRVGFWGPTGY
jgi:hypothetical protein